MKTASSKPTPAEVEFLFDAPFFNSIISSIDTLAQKSFFEIRDEILNTENIKFELLTPSQIDEINSLISLKFASHIIAELLETFSDDLSDGFRTLYDQKTAQLFKHAASFGYFISPNLAIDLLTISERSTTNDEFVIQLSKYFELEGSSNLIHMFDDWKTIPYINQRSQILDQVLTAHAQELHALTIPALLPLIDGLFEEYRNTQFKCYVNSHEKILKSISSPDLGSLNLFDYLSAMITNVFVKTADKIQPPVISQTLSRHATLHGTDPAYPSKENFYRVILMIDFLVFVFQNNLITRKDK